jgi:hypothetical protein
VPGMLTMISINEAAAARAGFGAGACPPESAMAAAPSAASADAFGRPRTGWAVRVLRPVITGRDQAAARPGLRKQYQNTTCTAMISGGGLGPHPPRDPV